jgi:exodeoxyribonuclease-1
VRATIALARLIREKQPKLYDYLVPTAQQAQGAWSRFACLQPTGAHLRALFRSAKLCRASCCRWAWHPINRNALIVCDLFHDPQSAPGLDARTSA